MRVPLGYLAAAAAGSVLTRLLTLTPVPEALLDDPPLLHLGLEPSGAPGALRAETGAVAHVDGSGGSGATATQGRVFRSARVREWSPRIDLASFSATLSRLGRERGRVVGAAQGPLQCERWVVITSIFPPTLLVRQLEKLPDWCLVVVGDNKSAPSYDVSPRNVVFLSSAAQSALGLRVLPLLPWNHFGRKNVGYLYAVANGAKVVYDTDDDNILRSGEIPLGRFEGAGDWGYELEREPSAASAAVNVYPLFARAQDAGQPPLWPRGLPLDRIMDVRSVPRAGREVPLGAALIIQSLADHDPDVDGIFRLSRPLPVFFGVGTEWQAALLPQRGALSPLNAQATLFKYDALWALLLPASVHGRVSDIWRSYLVQRVLWDTRGGRVAVCSPFVTQCRNSHNYLADMDAEAELYAKAGELVRVLEHWTPTAPTLAARLLEGAVLLYEHQFLGASDVRLFQAWLEDLAELGYRFPPLAEEAAAAAPPPPLVDDSLHTTAKSCEDRAVVDDKCALEAAQAFFQAPVLLSPPQPQKETQTQTPRQQQELLLLQPLPEQGQRAPPRLPQRDWSSLNWLLVDTHMAPQMDSLATLARDLNIKPGSIATLCMVNYCHRMHDIRDRYSSKPLHQNRTVVSRFSDWVQRTYLHHAFPTHETTPPEVDEVVRGFDVIMCSFPSWHCEAFKRSGKVLLLRFAHSPWHSLVRHDLWMDSLRDAARNPLWVVASNNPFNAQEYKHALGHFPLPWPATYLHVRGADGSKTYRPLDPSANDTLVLPVGENYSDYAKAVFDSLVARYNATAPRPRWSFAAFKPLVNPEEMRHTVSLALVFPYALHTAKINEMYALGVPLLLPSLELLEQSTRTGRARVGGLTHLDNFPRARGEGVCKHPLKISSTLTDAERFSDDEVGESLKRWAPLGDYYMWPGIYVYDTTEQLLERVEQIMAAPAERLLRSKLQLAFFDSVKHTYLPALTRSLDRALRVYEAGPLTTG
jgi:hypothetical protein